MVAHFHILCECIQNNRFVALMLLLLFDRCSDFVCTIQTRGANIRKK